MTELTPEILPSVWSLIRRSLLESPGMPKKELVERLTPRGLISRQGSGETTDDSRHVRPSLNALLELDVIWEDERSGLQLRIGAESEAAFRRAVTHRLFRVPAEDGSDIWRMRSELQPEYHAEIALAWLHLQGVARPISSFQAAEGLLQEQFGPARVLLRDTAPYNSLERLACWCGAAAQVAAEGAQRGIIPDPTDAVRAELDAILQPGVDAPAREVVDRIGEVLDWLPHGAVGRAVADRMSVVPDGSATTGSVPESLSLALIQLHHERVLELVAGDDSADRVTLSPGGLADAMDAEIAAVARVRRMVTA